MDIVLEGRAVLIETYWNVNTDLDEKAQEVARVLIETYWNVNKTK